jgi:hypothetical protein
MQRARMMAEAIVGLPLPTTLRRRPTLRGAGRRPRAGDARGMRASPLCGGCAAFVRMAERVPKHTLTRFARTARRGRVCEYGRIERSVGPPYPPNGRAAGRAG